MNLFTRALDAAHALDAVGAPAGDRMGRGVQPPQAEGAAEDDAAVRVGAAVYRVLTGVEPSVKRRLTLGRLAHYAFGAALGGSYALLGTAVPALRAGGGTLYGATVWVVADEGVMPALGLSRGPGELPVAVLGYGLAGHLVYGAALESVCAWVTGAPTSHGD